MASSAATTTLLLGLLLSTSAEHPPGMVHTYGVAPVRHNQTERRSTAAGAVDVIGYYGNAGLAVSSIPTLDQVDGNYNVIILTFASIALNGTFSLDGQIQGPYALHLDVLKRDIAAWKKGTDKYGRRRCVLVSIGGQNGRWPAGVASATLLAGAKAFFAEYGIDGLDLDLEGVYMYVCVCAQRACACVTMSNVTKGGGGPNGKVF